MRIGIVGSMQFAERMLELCDELGRLGHVAFVTDLHHTLVGKSAAEKETIKLYNKNERDAIRVFWRAMQGADAILVLNLEKNGIKDYIGGNTFLEIGFAHVLDQKIFLYNPIPGIPYYKTEIEAMRPIIIDGDLKKIQ